MISRCAPIAVIVATAFLATGACDAQVTVAPMLELFADPVHIAFGHPVSIDGDIAAVAYGLGLYIFERGPIGWQQAAFVDSFLSGPVSGIQLAMDGGVIIVGVGSDPGAGPMLAGAVYVIQRVGGGPWAVTNQLFASDPDAFDGFGSSVAIDGEWLLVGARGDDEAALGAGAAYVFSTSTWTQVDKLFGSSMVASGFGDAVSVRDGWAAIGTSQRGAYAFRLQGGGWVEEEFFPPPAPPGLTTFGCIVAAEGPTIVVTDVRMSVPGLAYIYEFDGAAWSETVVMTSVPEIGAGFGSPISMRGGRILFGEHLRDSLAVDSGRASLFEKIGGVWTETAYFLPSDLNLYNRFGVSLALDLDGHAFIGAVSDDTAGPDAGSAYLFYIGDGFRRGDANMDGAINIADVITTLIALFVVPGLPCEDSADANDDGELHIGDPITLLNWLFVPASPVLPIPSSLCGDDPTLDPLGCTAAVPCH